MKQAVIDIGSNSMRLTVYEIKENQFKALFKEKKMTGLAGYVENGHLSKEGIQYACIGLQYFKDILDALEVEQISVFATASLRNIDNTEEAVQEIKKVTKFNAEVLSGEEEASLGYIGASLSNAVNAGAYIDIGGASTEVVIFENKNELKALSFPLGSLSLYHSCVKKILPGEGSAKRIKKTIQKEMKDACSLPDDHQKLLLCTGGTSRAVLKLVKKLYDLPDDCSKVTAEQFKELCRILKKSDSEAIDLILKLTPDRIHTIVPGTIILEYLFDHFNADELVVSDYGVREGYLWQKVMKNAPSMSIHKIES